MGVRNSLLLLRPLVFLAATPSAVVSFISSGAGVSGVASLGAQAGLGFARFRGGNTRGMSQTSASKPTLYDVPVSNHGARCRYIIYEKGISDKVDIVSPFEAFEGLKSPEYLAVNPQGKMPALRLEDGSCVPESDTISRYLLDRFSDEGPSLTPKDLKMRTLSNKLTRLLDTYIGPIQGCLYKATPPFGPFQNRALAVAELQKQLTVLEDLVKTRTEGPWLTGKEASYADASLFPTFIFLVKILPKFGVSSPLPPLLAAWFEHVKSQPTGAKIFQEMDTALDGWEASGRWDAILGAGFRDVEPATIFDKILAGEIPSTKVHEDDMCLAFRDINPVAPTHILIIPKKREGLTRLSAATPDNAGVLGHMLVKAADIAKQEGLEGCRLVINDGPLGCQEVYHLHMHLVGGRQMKWPPG